MNFLTLFAALFIGYYVSTANATLKDCFEECYDMPEEYQLGCKYYCCNKYTFGAVTLNSREECYNVCNTLPSVFRPDCIKGCDFEFRYDFFMNPVKVEKVEPKSECQDDC